MAEYKNKTTQDIYIGVISEDKQTILLVHKTDNIEPSITITRKELIKNYEPVWKY